MIDKIRALSSLPTRDKVAFENFTLLNADSVRTTDPHINQMLCYFEEKAGQKRLARRGDIVPGELKELLSEIALLKPVFENEQELLDVTVQLMGTKLARFYGEQTGNSIYATPSRQVADRIFTACQHCINMRAPIVTEASSFSSDKPFLSLRALFVPMAEDGDHIDQLFAYGRIMSRDAARAVG